MEEEKDRLVIKKNMKKNIKYFLVSMIFVIIGLGYVFVDINDIGMVLIGIVAIIFFGFSALFFIKKSLENKDMVVVDKYGITDNSSAISLGFIAWEDIEDIYFDSALGNGFILIKLKDEEKYLQKVSTYKQKLLQSSKEMGYEIVSISLNLTNVDPKVFLQKILEFKNNLSDE